MEIGYGCVYRNLVETKSKISVIMSLWSLLTSNLIFPFKLLPHLSKLCVSAGGRKDIIHDVNVYCIKYNHIVCT